MIYLLWNKGFNFRKYCFLISFTLFFLTDVSKSAAVDIPSSGYPAIFDKTSTTDNNLQKPEVKITRLSLADVVVLVLANNTEIKNAYLDRITQKQDLTVAEGKFRPILTPTLSFSVNRLGEVTNTLGSLDAKFVVKVSTGGEFSFGWTGNTQGSNISNTNNIISRSLNNDSFNQNLQLSFRQPLLKGAGTSLNQASIAVARLNETSNINNLKSTLSDTITKAILAYRELLQAQERVKIEQLSLKNAEESLEVTKVLIDAGRVAPVDIVQNQTDIANRRVSLLSARNELESKKLLLISILNIKQNTNIEAGELPTVKPTQLELEKLRQIALQNQPNYLNSLLNLDKNKIDLKLAEDEKRWDLSFTASLGDATNQDTDARAGLSLSRVIGDLSINQRFERSRVELLKTENTVRNVRTQLDIDLQDKIRNIQLSFSQLELARQATQLSVRQLEIEQEKQKLGKSRLLDIIKLQNDLVQAKNNELNATIIYLNSLTSLDQFLGTTLQTWQVSIEK
jgi:outer membrane protein TolC